MISLLRLAHTKSMERDGGERTPLITDINASTSTKLYSESCRNCMGVLAHWKISILTPKLYSESCRNYTRVLVHWKISILTPSWNHVI